MMTHPEYSKPTNHTTSDIPNHMVRRISEPKKTSATPTSTKKSKSKLAHVLGSPFEVQNAANPNAYTVKFHTTSMSVKLLEDSHSRDESQGVLVENVSQNEAEIIDFEVTNMGNILSLFNTNSSNVPTKGTILPMSEFSSVSCCPFVVSKFLIV